MQAMASIREVAIKKTKGVSKKKKPKKRKGESLLCKLRGTAYAPCPASWQAEHRHCVHSLLQLPWLFISRNRA